MRKSADNIKALLRKGVFVTLCSDDYRFSELMDFARIAASSETEMVLVIGDNLTFPEVDSLASAARGHLRVDLSKD